MILVIDNYDSFTQNLVQCIGQIVNDVYVVRNDQINFNNIDEMQPTHIIISPGPGTPTDTGICLELIAHYADRIPILGVCLGHQAIGYVYGANIKQLNHPMHGKLSQVWHDNTDIFANLPNPFLVARYHSLFIDYHNLPLDIEITARTQDGIIMGCHHKKYLSLRGIQFHPESLWTQEGQLIIKNFLSM